MKRVINKKQAVAAIEAELLKRVRARGQISRVELARDLKIVPSTAGIYVDRLIREKFLTESRKTERGFGRPPTLLMLNPKGGRFVGVDFEARNLMATAVDFSQQPLKQAHRNIAASDPAETILTKLEDAIAEVTGDHRRDVLGIGIGLPGVIDPAQGVAVEYEMIAGWRNVPIRQRLANRFDTPVFLENNIRSMALAEMWFGQGRGVSDFICLGTRSGIAAGIVVGGQLLRGHDQRAGEVGHWSCPSIPANGRSEAAPLGKPWVLSPEQTIERVASLTAIYQEIRKAREAGIKSRLTAGRGAPNIAEFIGAVEDGDAFACELLDRVARMHGWLVHQLNELFNPQKIILAGPLTACGDKFLAPIRELVRLLSPHGPQPEISASTLGDYNGAVGAAALALHQWKPAR